MALDHFVSQVHLRNFYSPALGERLYAVRKSDGKSFAPNSESICRIEAGSTNAYLTNDRAIEEFLKGVEPKYNAAARKLAQGQIDPEVIYVIAGFISYILSCSPTAMRLHTASLEAILRTSARALDAAGAFPEVPEALGSKSLTELLGTGAVQLKVDPKYPQAVGISNTLKMVLTLGNSAWEVLKNPFTDSPFFTSDYPDAIEDSGDPRVVNHIVPLTPFVAIRILPDISLRRDQLDFTFGRHRFRQRQLARDELLAVNRLLVQCAEDLVLYRDDHPWVKAFIAKYSAYYVETVIQELPTSGETLVVAQQKIVRKR